MYIHPHLRSSGLQVSIHTYPPPQEAGALNPPTLLGCHRDHPLRAFASGSPEGLCLEEQARLYARARRRGDAWRCGMVWSIDEPVWMYVHTYNQTSVLKTSPNPTNTITHRHTCVCTYIILFTYLHLLCTIRTASWCGRMNGRSRMVWWGFVSGVDLGRCIVNERIEWTKNKTMVLTTTPVWFTLFPLFFFSLKKMYVSWVTIEGYKDEWRGRMDSQDFRSISDRRNDTQINLRESWSEGRREIKSSSRTKKQKNYRDNKRWSRWYFLVSNKCGKSLV